MIPPPELQFYDWIIDATTVAKQASPDNAATLLDATAVKKTIRNGNALDIVARFQSSDSMILTITASSWNDKSAFKVTKNDEGLARIGNTIDDPQNLPNSPWDICADNKKTQSYVRFKFFRPDSSSLTANEKSVDQPYYEYFDAEGKSLGAFGASDGLEYSV